MRRKGGQLTLGGRPFRFAGATNYYMLSRAVDRTTRPQVPGRRNHLAPAYFGVLQSRIAMRRVHNNVATPLASRNASRGMQQGGLTVLALVGLTGLLSLQD